MYQHHLDSIEKMKEYFFGREGVIALVLGGFAGTGFATIALLLAGSAVVGILAFLGDIDLLGAL